MQKSLFKSALCVSGLVATLFASACTEDKPISGFDLLDPSFRGEVKREVFSDLEVEAAFQDTIITTGTKTNILSLGAFQDIETRILVRFGTIPDTADITFARLLMRTNEIVGTGDVRVSWRATVHEITRSWGESTILADSVDGSFFNSTILGSTEILPIVGDVTGQDSAGRETVRFDFNDSGIELVRQWSDTLNAPFNFGVLVDFDDSAPYIKEFFARSSFANQPLLELHTLRNETERDTVFIPAVADAFVANRRPGSQLPSQPLFVDNVFNQQAVLKFDLSRMDSLTTINELGLEVSVMEEFTIANNSGMLVQLVPLAEPFTGDSLKFDDQLPPISSSINTEGTTTISTSTVRSLFQAWVLGAIDNHGFVIRTGTPGADVSRIALNTTRVNVGLGAKAVITFTAAPPVQ